MSLTKEILGYSLAVVVGFGGMCGFSYATHSDRLATRQRQDRLTERHQSILQEAKAIAGKGLLTEDDAFALEMAGNFFWSSHAAGRAFKHGNNTMDMRAFLKNFNDEPHNKATGEHMRIVSATPFRGHPYYSVIIDSAGVPTKAFVLDKQADEPIDLGCREVSTFALQPL